MNVRPLSRDEVRSIDRIAADNLALPGLVLMENAGRGAAELLRQYLPLPARVLVLCGNGNNGGDGGVVARHLDAWGYGVQLVWLGSPSRRSADAQAQYSILEKAGFDQQSFPAEFDARSLDPLIQQADWLVDALLGTGLNQPVSGPLALAIEAINRSGRPVLSLDLPSGLDADTGAPLGLAVEATFTATFVAPKAGFLTPAAVRYTGPVHIVDIGVPRRLLAPYLLESAH